MSNKLTEKKIKELHAAIGRFVLAWADVELGLDLLVIISHRQSDRSQSRQRHELREKIKFIRSKANNLPSLNPFRSTIHELIDEIEGISDARNDYVHGAAIGHMIERSILSITMGRLLQPAKGLRRKPIRVTALQIARTSDRLHTIGGRLLDIVEGVNNIGRHD
jgi:hypothetical protein